MAATLVARSALLTLTASPADHALSLQIARVSDRPADSRSGNVTRDPRRTRSPHHRAIGWQLARLNR